jgi:hypothetical protein
MSAAYQEHVALPQLRAKEAERSGYAELQREAAALNERQQNQVAREFDRLLGPTRIK